MTIQTRITFHLSAITKVAIKTILLMVTLLPSSCSLTTKQNESRYPILDSILLETQNNMLHNGYCFIVTSMDCELCIQEISLWVKNNPNKDTRCIYVKEENEKTPKYQKLLEQNKISITYTTNMEIIRATSSLLNDKNGPFMLEIAQNKTISIKQISYN